MKIPVKFYEEIKPNTVINPAELKQGKIVNKGGTLYLVTII